MPADFLVPNFRLGSVEPRGAAPYVSVDAPPGAFGATGAVQLAQAGQQLDKASTNFQGMFEREAKLANDTRVQQLNDQYLAGQNAVLFTGEGAFYQQKGEAAIHAAPVTMKTLTDLKATILAQAGNAVQRDELGKRLSYHTNEAAGAMGRHVANQSLVWQDAVAKGKATNAGNEMVLFNNDTTKIELHAAGGWQTEYDRTLKGTGSPEAAKASADGWRSNAFKAALVARAVDDPGGAQRLLDAHRDWLDASDAPGVSAVIKDAAQKRKTQDIVGLVAATGGVSPNYNARVVGAEGAASWFEENKIGALGKYQFTKATYTDLAQQTEWGKGKSQAEVRELLLERGAGPKRQEELQGLYNARSVEKLGAAGVPVNDLTLYATHFLGHGAGPKILKLPDDTPLQAGLIKAHGNDAAYAQEVVDANPFLAKVQTVGDLKALLAQKIGAPQTLATSGSPQKPNLDAMLASGLAMAGSDPDLRDRVTQAIKVDYQTKHALYAAQIGAVEKQAFGHIDAGGTIENLPTTIRANLDADGLAKVQVYEEKRLAKRQKDNAEAAGKALADLESLGQLNVDAVEKARTALPEKEYRAWQRRAVGIDRTDDPGSYERLQRGLGTRDMRDDIFSEFNAGNLSRESMDRLLDKNAAFVKDGSAPTPYRINHDRITRSLDPGLMGSGISREIYGRAVKEYDQYVTANPQQEGENSGQFRKRLDDFAEDTIKRHQMFNTQEMSISKAVPAHATLNRSAMTGPRPEAVKQISAANAELAKKFADGLITEDQYNRDAITLGDWLQFVNDQEKQRATQGKK